MIKLKLKPNLLKKTSIAEASRTSGITYPTLFRMIKGKWYTKSIDLLARYLVAIGYDAKTLAEAKFSDVFALEEEVKK